MRIDYIPKKELKWIPLQFENSDDSGISIEIGKTYKTRAGDLRQIEHSAIHPLLYHPGYRFSDTQGNTYLPTGRYLTFMTTDCDLVEEIFSEL